MLYSFIRFNISFMLGGLVAYCLYPGPFMLSYAVGAITACVINIVYMAGECDEE